MDRTDGRLEALSGDENPDLERRIATGPRNQIIGASTAAEAPRPLSPGEHPSAFAIELDPASTVAWKLDGNVAVFNSASPRCAGFEYSFSFR